MGTREMLSKYREMMNKGTNWGRGGKSCPCHMEIERWEIERWETQYTVLHGKSAKKEWRRSKKQGYGDVSRERMTEEQTSGSYFPLYKNVN